LERLQSAAQERGWAGILVEILVLKALAQQVQDDLPASLIPLHQALTLAESEGYVRLFVDEGPSMMQLLLEAASHGILCQAIQANYWPHLKRKVSGMKVYILYPHLP
jgi:LuxR family maltose regulon positive regulatory protein